MICFKIITILTRFFCPWLMGESAGETCEIFSSSSLSKWCIKVPKSAKIANKLLKSPQKCRTISTSLEIIVLVLLFAHAKRVCVSRYTSCSPIISFSCFIVTTASACLLCIYHWHVCFCNYLYHVWFYLQTRVSWTATSHIRLLSDLNDPLSLSLWVICQGQSHILRVMVDLLSSTVFFFIQFRYWMHLIVVVCSVVRLLCFVLHCHTC